MTCTDDITPFSLCATVFCMKPWAALKDKAGICPWMSQYHKIHHQSHALEAWKEQLHWGATVSGPVAEGIYTKAVHLSKYLKL